MTTAKENKNTNNVNYLRQITGLILFINLFFFIALLLYKGKYYYMLEGYLPNIDLIATALSWHGGPRGSWKKLYPASPITKYGFMSQVIINYFALLGLTYIIAREAKETRNIVKGWSMGFVMILMTYLLPSQATIIPIMKYVNKLNIPSRFHKLIVSGVGLITAVIIIYMESLILKYFSHHLYKVGKAIVRIPKIL